MLHVGVRGCGSVFYCYGSCGPVDLLLTVNKCIKLSIFWLQNIIHVLDIEYYVQNIHCINYLTVKLHSTTDIESREMFPVS